MQVSNLWIYPIKGCRGVAVTEFTLDDRGPMMDRRFMLVDSGNVFMSQRGHPRMALIDVEIAGDRITVGSPDSSPFSFDMRGGFDAEEAEIWNDTVSLRHVSPEADRWFSEFLGTPCRLMRMPTSTQRSVDAHYSPEHRLVSLADAFPMLLIGSGSLELLNRKLAEHGEAAVPMQRFRPNVVVNETAPHAEDEWKRIRIGDVACRIVKPCARCAVTTVDIATGIAGKEPLRTLSEYRKVGSKVMFGQNVIHDSEGTIRLGDTVSLNGA